jgi:hypothetical protein
MYLRSVRDFGQSGLAFAFGAPCLQDDVAGRVESARRSDHTYKNLDAFRFRSVVPRTWHRAWIRQQLVPTISRSFETAEPIRTVLLVGDADELGAPLVNYQIGLARAQAIKKEIARQLSLAGGSLSGKVAIEALSRGECSPVVGTGKKEARNRRVEVFAMHERHAAPPGATPGPPPLRKAPNLFDFSEKMRRDEEQRAFQRRLFAPIPPSPQGKSLEDQLREALRGVPAWLRRKIVDAIFKGSCAAVAQLLAQSGRSRAEQEAAKAICEASVKMKMR